MSSAKIVNEKKIVFKFQNSLPYFDTRGTAKRCKITRGAW